MQVLYLDRAPRTKETLPNFLKWRRVTRRPLVLRGLTGSQRTPGFGASQIDFNVSVMNPIMSHGIDVPTPLAFIPTLYPPTKHLQYYTIYHFSINCTCYKENNTLFSLRGHLML